MSSAHNTVCAQDINSSPWLQATGLTVYAPLCKHNMSQLELFALKLRTFCNWIKTSSKTSIYNKIMYFVQITTLLNYKKYEII